MTTETDAKDLAYFEANPDEMPDDPAAIEALMNGGTAEPLEVDHYDPASRGATPKEEPAEPADDTPADDAAKATETDEPAAGEEPEAPAATQDDEKQTPEGVLARDGKNVIPYTVLENTRSRLHETETELDTYRRKLEEAEEAKRELLQRIEAQSRGEDPEHASTADDTGDDERPDFEKLREEFPEEIASALERSYKRIDALTTKVAQLESSAAEAEQDRETETRSSVQVAIDANETLSKLQSEGGLRWEAAKAIDNGLRDDPEWKNRSLEDRFAEVVRVLNGESSKQGTDTGGEEGDEVAAAAARKLAEAEGDTPSSLSDIPGGSPAADTRIGALEDASVMQIAETIDQLGSTDAMEDWLASQGV